MLELEQEKMPLKYLFSRAPLDAMDPDL